MAERGPSRDVVLKVHSFKRDITCSVYLEYNAG